MSRRRKRKKGDGEIYQVDLIAALFAGYTIIWIATTDRAKVVSEQTDLEVATLSMWIEGALTQYTGSAFDYLHRAAPIDMLEAGCAPNTFDQYIDEDRTNWTVCEAARLPKDLDDGFSDALSMLEVSVKTADPPKTPEPCISTYEQYKSASPTSYARILDASLIHIAGLEAFSLVGLGYQVKENDWPAAPFNNSRDLIPRFLGIEDDYYADYEPKTMADPYACAYERDRRHLLQTLYVVDGDEFERDRDTITLTIESSATPDLYHLFAEGHSQSLSFKSKTEEPPEGSGIRDDNTLRVQKDFNISNPMLLMRLCHHKDAEAECWQGQAFLRKGATINLAKE